MPLSNSEQLKRMFPSHSFWLKKFSAKQSRDHCVDNAEERTTLALNKRYRLKALKLLTITTSKLNVIKKCLENLHRLIGGLLLLWWCDYLPPFCDSRAAHFFIQPKNVFSPDITQIANTSQPHCYYENYWGQKNSREGL